MATSKYTVRQNEGFAACVAKFSVLYGGKIVHRCNEIDACHDFIISQLPPPRTQNAMGLTGSYPAQSR